MADADRPAIPPEGHLQIAQAAFRAICRIVGGELENDLERVKSSDFVEQLYLAAYWTRRITTLFEGLGPEQSTDEVARLTLIMDQLGHGLGMPSALLKVDITQRLDWMKRRVAKDFEREFREAIDWNTVKSPVEQICLMEWQYRGWRTSTACASIPSGCWRPHAASSPSTSA